MNAIEVRNITKEYPTFKLQDVSFNVEEGHIVGFIGRNGAGKTTTIKSILNIVKPKAEASSFSVWILKAMKILSKPNRLFQRHGKLLSAQEISRYRKCNKSFFPDWDDNLMNEYKALFQLDFRKHPANCGRHESQVEPVARFKPSCQNTDSR